ncbi:MAG: hypothetical protein L0271_22880, partial [Gemmatimonadetes bacterium]|nr:hypothetical protein [Gemmatimonadota bacterium]
LAGALEEPTGQAFLLFQGPSPEQATRFDGVRSLRSAWSRKAVARQTVDDRSRGTFSVARETDETFRMTLCRSRDDLRGWAAEARVKLTSGRKP